MFYLFIYFHKSFRSFIDKLKKKNQYFVYTTALRNAWLSLF